MCSFKKIWIWGKIISAAVSVVYGIANIVAGFICLFDQEAVSAVMSSGLYQKVACKIGEIWPGLAGPMADAGTMQIFIVVESFVFGLLNIWLAWRFWRKLYRKNS